MDIRTGIKTSTVALAAAAAASSGAVAADMAFKAAPVYAPPSWAGWYIGGSAGGGWLHSIQDDSAAGASAAISGYQQPGFPVGSTGSGGAVQTANGVFGMFGLNLGYNFQSGNFVYGVEADISWMNAKSSSNSGLNAVAPPFFFFTNYQEQAATAKSTKIDALATFRGRFGLDFNGTMPYLTAGFAIADTQNSFSVSGYNGNTGAMNTFTTTQKSWVPGVVIGAGIEHQLARNWTLRGEVMWVGFESKDVANPWPSQPRGYVTTTGAAKISNDITIAKVGLNYRF